MALTDNMTTDEIANSEARYGLHVTPETAEWLVSFAVNYKGTKADTAAFSAVADAVRASFGDKNEGDADGRKIHALYLPLFDADGVSCETVMNRVADVIGKRSGRSKADKAAIADLRVELTGAMADMQVRLIPAPLEIAPVTAPAETPAPVVPAAPVKVKRTRKAKAAPKADAPAPVVEEESAPVAPAEVPAPVVAPGDVVAAIAVKVGAMINRWAPVTQNLRRMTGAQRVFAAQAMARDFAECVALQADADGNGTPLATLDADANRIMFAARKILKDTHGTLSGSTRFKGDRLTKTQRLSFRRTVAPWRADATRAAQ